MTETPAHYQVPRLREVNIIAIDPGLKGAIAFSNPISARPLPLAGKKELDLVTLAQWVEAAAPQLAVIEKVGAMPKQGVASTFKFGKGYGGLLGVCAALQIPVELITPQTWKRVVLAGSPKDKDAAIAYCRRVFPTVDLIPNGRRKPSDGMADALCILQYGLRRLVGVEAA